MLITLAACGGDDGNKATPDAAAPATDAATATATVKTVTCPATPAAMVMSTADNDTTFMPASTTVHVNDIVKFAMASTHNVAPYTGMPTDPGLKVDFGATACLQFTATGTFTFLCTAHGFHGTVIVQ
ncbi:MAG TPA: hypothetical protein VH165_16925 [Kofleriaceae bacterium]|nr:hypothetical protein [Kofleriaceae bacterium]